ncbi:hypothetical protein JCM3770_003886 [Rhodotorula araucariae]
MPAHSPPRNASPLIVAHPASPPPPHLDVHTAHARLISLPPSPDPSVHPDEDVEHLADPAVEQPPMHDRTHPRRPSLLGFIEPEVQRPSSNRGRERKRSFIGGFGFGGGGTSSESDGPGRRRISFGSRGVQAAPDAGENPWSLASGASPFPSVLTRYDLAQGACWTQLTSPPPTDSTSPSSSTPAAPAPRKPSSGPKALLRRAKSFGTSPILGSSNDGGFGPPASGSYSNTALPLPAPHLSPSTLSLDTSARTSPAAPSQSHSGNSTPLTPHSPYPDSASSQASASGSTMVLPEPMPSQPHWLFAPAPRSKSAHTAGSSGGSAPRSSGEHERRSGESTGGARHRSADERARTHGGGDAKGKGKERKPDERAASVPPAPAPKRKTRRATLGGLFGRRESKAAAEEARRSAEGAGSGAYAEGGVVYDSPTGSPALDTGGASTDAGGAIPSLPSLPSLQLSQNPYRMSWAFGRDSPSSSPEKARLVQPSSEDFANRSMRPALAITTTPINSSPVPASPIDENLLSAGPHPGTPNRPALVSMQTVPLPSPHESTKSTDSAATLLIRDPASAQRRPSTSPSPASGSSSASHPPTRSGVSASSPRSLRRANSYAPPSSSPRMYSTTPITRSPLSTPSKERPNPLGAASSSSSPAGTGTHSPGAGASPSLARTFVQTRAARSHSDASDRRSPSSPAASPYFGARGMVVGGFGVPAGGGAFAGAGLKAGQGRPGTADGTTGGRASVFGSLGSFFSSSSSSSSAAAPHSQGMSRSSSAATSSVAGTPAPSPGLAVEVNEFGALFDGGGAGDRRASALARPGSTRKRGLSVGASLGGLFGHSSSHGAGSSTSLAVGTGANSPTKLLQQQQSGRARSGSASSAGSGLSPLDAVASSSSSVGGRMRALTDPSRRFSLASFGSGSGSGPAPGGGGGGGGGLAPPGAGAARPGSSDGAGAGAGSRSRGNSVSGGSPVPLAARRESRVRKAPRPRVDEGETPEEYVKRLLDGEKSAEGWRASRAPSGDAEEADGEEEVLEQAGEVGGEGEKDPLTAAEDEGCEPLPRGDVTRVLASNSDPFHLAALQAYLRLFPFHHLALDIALRVFLSSASLPTETQQIDRVMEAFARRYCECNPDLFGAIPKKRDAGDEGLSGEGSQGEEGRPGLRRDGQEESDIPYVLAFSMVMLNTDHFNPNAKSKMTKADYVKNTRIEGVAPELLEYLYDQITAAPFIYVNDDDPATSLFTPSASTTSLLGGSVGPSGSAPSSATAGGSSFFGSNGAKNRLDPYYLIATGQMQRFKVDVESHIPPKSPFSFTGTTSFFDTTALHALFARAPILQISNRPRSSSKPQPAHVTAVAPYPLSPDPSSSAIPPHLAGSPLVPTVSNGTFIADPPKKRDRPPVSTLKITKIGLLSRKEDLGEGGKKAASRKWRGWTVILTGSQLLFFKDPHFAGTLHRALEAAAAATEPKPDDHQVLVFSWQNSFKPDAVLSLAHSAAIYDSSYSKYRNVFRLVAPAGRQYLFQAHDTTELNSWLHAINYAAAFKTAGLRIRALLPASPALASSQRQSPVPSSPQFSTFTSSSGRNPPADDQPDLPRSAASRLLRSDVLGSLASASTSGTISGKGTLAATGEDLASGPSATIAVNGAGVDNAELVLSVSLQQALEANGANGKSSVEDNDDDVPLGELSSSRPPDLPFAPPAPPATPTRADLLRKRVQQLDGEIRAAKHALQGDLRLAKHLAILTPFRHTTRERVITAIPPIENRVRHARMQLAKLVCYREVLSRDVLVEDREAERLLRKQSAHRSHSRRTSSHHRPRSPPRQHAHHVSRHATIKASTRPSGLSRSHTSLHPASAATSDGERHSFESTADLFSGLVSDAHPTSLTDDELDRLQVRSPPLMQRSKTETDWAGLAPVESLAHGESNGAAAGPQALLHPDHHLHLHSEDELEPRPPPRDAGGDTPVRSESFVLPAPATPTPEPGSPVEQMSAHLPVSLAPPVLETRRSR